VCEKKKDTSSCTPFSYLSPIASWVAIEKLKLKLESDDYDMITLLIIVANREYSRGCRWECLLENAAVAGLSLVKACVFIRLFSVYMNSNNDQARHTNEQFIYYKYEYKQKVNVCNLFELSFPFSSLFFFLIV
jgi:hypothetical protein